MVRFSHVQRNITDGVVFLILLLFSWLVMASTLSGDQNGNIHIASKAWSDFGAHTPLIRSFSYGENFPPQSPIFPGEKIRYHFLFYALAGLLERIGFPFALAVNIPSAFGLFLYLACIYLVGIQFFKSRNVGMLAVLFIICNGSLSFINFFRTHPLGNTSVLDIVTNSKFPSFGPWDGQDISAFWNMNIFTNQRHLGLSYGLILLCLLILLKIKAAPRFKQTLMHGAILSAGIGILLFMNQAAALILLLFSVWIFCISKVHRLILVTSALLSIPWVVAYLLVIAPSSIPVWDPGYLTHSIFPKKILLYWIKNIGLHSLLIPVGMILAPKRIQKLFIVPLSILFIVPNLIRFSPDMINNHKFFNFYMAFGSLFSAWSLLYLWKVVAFKKRIHPVAVFFQHMWTGGGRTIVIIAIGMLTISGIIDLFPIFNDGHYSMTAGIQNPDIRAYFKLVPPKSIVLNSTFFANPASLAGRPIFFGYPYFTWSYGYVTDRREKLFLALWRARDKETACRLATIAGISFAELSNDPEEYLKPNAQLWNTEFIQIYKNKSSGYILFDIANSCPALSGT